MDDFGRSVILTALRRERKTFAGNLRRSRDVQQIIRYERVLAAFDEQIADLEAPARPGLKAVA